MSSPYEPSAAGLRYRRRGWSSVFRTKKRRRDELPLPPRPKDVDRYHADRYIKTGQQNRPNARGELHANYAHEVARRLEERDVQYLKYLEHDLATHWIREEPMSSADAELKRILRVLNKDYCALIRPRLDAFFDMPLPLDEYKRNGGDNIPSETEYSLISEERRQRIQYIESATAVAWCRYQLEDLHHRMKLDTYARDKIWEVNKDLQQPEDVAEAAGKCLDSERDLDYFLLLEATLKERIPELEKAQSSQGPLKTAKMAYKDSKKLSTDADNSAPSTVAFHRTVGRTCRDLKQPESQHMRTKVQETGFWVAWALSRLDSTHPCRDNWLEELGSFLERAREQGLRDAGPTILLLKEYSALAPFAEGREQEVAKWETRPPRPVHRISLPAGGMGNLDRSLDNLSGTTSTARSGSTSHDAAS